MNLVVHSPDFKELLEQAAAYAPRNFPLLLLGPTGTGKSEVARFVHGKSGRSGPLIEVNCAAIPSSLFERELFGTVAEAFTGATKSAPGKVAAANRGTLFLDEVGELDLAVQAKLLDVIQEQRVTALGAVHPIPVDVRFIAATNRNLKKMMRTGKFREDLYYRLSTAVLGIPSLAERKTDILPLADHFLQVICRREDIGPLAFSEAARQKMLTARWRGNVRELSSVVERAAVRCAIEKTPIIEPAHLFPSATATQLGLKESTKHFQRALFEDALRRNEGSISGAAKSLKIGRSYAYNLVRKLGIKTSG